MEERLARLEARVDMIMNALTAQHHVLHPTVVEIGFPEPTFTSVVPSNGLDGEAVVITGTGFRAGVIVEFEGDLATSIVLISETEINCNAPTRPDGAADLRITNTDALFVSASAAFTYDAAA